MNNHKNRPLMLAIAALLNAPHTEGGQIAQQVLPEVKVKTTAEKEPAYKADTSSTGLKFETAIRDIPQSVSVVKEELVKSQNAFNLRDALKNVSGLTIAAGERGRTGDSITLRGTARLAPGYGRVRAGLAITAATPTPRKRELRQPTPFCGLRI